MAWSSSDIWVQCYWVTFEAYMMRRDQKGVPEPRFELGFPRSVYPPQHGVLTTALFKLIAIIAGLIF